MDIVQAAGRAMRQSKATGKSHGYILITVIVPEGQALDQFAESTDFAAVARVITSLSTQDERIVEELRNREPGKPPNPDDIIIVDPDIIEALDVDYETFNDAVSTRIWASVGRANWRPFEEAKEFVRSQNIESETAWREWSKSKLKPADIPVSAPSVYSEWVSWGDWLGTGSIATTKVMHLSFEAARNFARSLNLKSRTEWIKYTKLENLPAGMPVAPWQVYEGEVYVDFQDFFGTEYTHANKRTYMPFKEARQIVRKLNLKNQKDWFEYTKSGKLSSDIPRNPQQVYTEWLNLGDWLGTGVIA